MPTFGLNKKVVLEVEAYGLDFALSMIELRGFGGKTAFWDHGRGRSPRTLTTVCKGRC
jgi:pyrimidine oxygenase